MHTLVRQGLSKIIYSVIEKGICRIVTSQHSYLLDELKIAYSQNVPENHHLVWLPGNICSLEQLSQVLVEAGVLKACPSFDRQQLLEQIKEHLILCHQQHILEIWVFENAEHLSAQVVKLLAELSGWRYLEHALYSFELWGNAQLDALYHSECLKIDGCAQHYYIPIGQPILIKDSPAKISHKFIPGFSVLALGIVLGGSAILLNTENLSPALANYFNHNVNKLATDLTVEPAIQADDLPFRASEQVLVKIPSAAGLIAPSKTIQQADDLLFRADEQTLVKIPSAVGLIEPGETIQSEIDKDLMHSHRSGLAPVSPLKDGANSGLREHWYFALDFSSWIQKYQIDLSNDIDRSKGMFYLQLGLYQKQQSLDDFFTASVLPNQTYHFCYIQNSNLVALLSGIYPSARQAYYASSTFTTAGYSSMVVGVNHIKHWQCNMGEELTPLAAKP